MGKGSTNTIGLTAATLQHLLVDAGAVYKNYALANEALIGATSGGNEFDIKPKTRDIKVDGIKGTVKGLTQLVSTEVSLKVNMLEITTDTLKMALMADVDTASNPDYDIITGKNNIELSDYIDNIALVGTISGSTLPIVIILKNALSTDGIKFSNKDAADNLLPITFTANVDPAIPAASVYEIHYPKITDGVLFSIQEIPIIDNGKIVLTFNEIVAATVAKDGFVVTIDGVADIVTASARGVNNLYTIALTLTTSPTSGQVVTVAYTKPTLDANDVKSLEGIVLNTFEATAVTNN
ncbi:MULTISPECIES: SwmB domain-containing protein [Clostridium]|uniref:SwmB domain-containing protein n=1 Tax=Clostridium frigoriphilum TaxID=443253 RepID=A0ABU7UHM9_9CLOT|nr:SwmB domain-containing protein [Clostridium sp. DSM 17811]MBU3098385.1 hypothetical protein [Clostridium sp. DSM 17811]